VSQIVSCLLCYKTRNSPHRISYIWQWLFPVWLQTQSRLYVMDLLNYFESCTSFSYKQTLIFSRFYRFISPFSISFILKSNTWFRSILRLNESEFPVYHQQQHAAADVNIFNLQFYFRITLDFYFKFQPSDKFK